MRHSESPAVDTSGWTGGAESLCHRQMRHAVCYVVDNGVKWRSVPVDFPARDRVHAFSAGSGAGWNAPDRRSVIRAQQGSLAGITSSTPAVRVAVPVAALVRPSVPTA